ncbi:hypothetical protein [Thalassobacillus cyri]|uniref:hypothetical protein n=1 Tax=Thalassobacillus cyri TaxID=571932 RepID=UPI000B80B361|nr:hypothetical protein [Thalassobacillus cyri]
MLPYRTEVKEVHELLGAGAGCQRVKGGGEPLGDNWCENIKENKAIEKLKPIDRFLHEYDL